MLAGRATWTFFGSCSSTTTIFGPHADSSAETPIHSRRYTKVVMLRRTFVAMLPILPAAAAQNPVLVPPYINLGDDPTRYAVIFHTQPSAATFTVRSGGREYPVSTVVIENPPHQVHAASIPPGDYEILLNGASIFRSSVRARPTVRHRFVILGDPGQNTAQQRGLAEYAKSLDPDFLFFGGDMVYEHGRTTDYLQKFFPIYDGLLRQRLWVAIPGNHDTDESNFSSHPDGYAFFHNWQQPSNGPVLATTPTLKGNPKYRDAFLKAAGSKFPRALNFSFNYANAHWTIIDTNKYNNMRDPKLREWIEADLTAARGYRWRFVGMHHPAFNSARKHAEQQHPRWLADLFEKHEVDVVFSGHVHNYQRSYPLRFLNPSAGSGLIVRGNVLPDKEGRNGVIYVISGSGGAALHNSDQEGKPKTWQPFTAAFHSRVHSLSVVDIDAGKLTFRQLTVSGRQLDSFTIQK